MAIMIPNEFTSYELTLEEAQQGTLLTNAQKQVLSNQLYTCASDKLRLIMDPTNPMDYSRKAAYLRGQMDAIAYILEQSSQLEITLHNNNLSN